MHKEQPSPLPRAGSVRARELLMLWGLTEHLAAQIRANREQRGWAQAELATRAGLSLKVVQQLEAMTVLSELPSLEALKKIASAFDCGLMVNFVAWSQFLRWAGVLPGKADVSADELEVPSRDDDPGLRLAALGEEIPR